MFIDIYRCIFVYEIKTMTDYFGYPQTKETPMKVCKDCNGKGYMLWRFDNLDILNKHFTLPKFKECEYCHGVGYKETEK